jgi:outer membrane protein assembly factor BamB
MTHDKTNVAAPTPCSDGQRIFAFFSSNDLFCLDLDGNLLWLRGLTYDYPNASNSLGMASSPVVVGDTLVVQCENDSESFAVGLATADGTNRWRKDRPKAANWTSPVLLASGDQTTVVLQSSRGLLGIAPATGSELWEYDAGASTIPSCAVSGTTVYAPSSGLTALTPGASGGVSQAWRNEQARPKTGSPVAYQGRLYFPEGGVLTAIDAASGERLWKTRIQGDYSASPVAAANRLYLFNENGVGQIVPLDTADAEPAVSTQIELGETVLGTPAISGGAIYVRSDAHLWKLVEPKS